MALKNMIKLKDKVTFGRAGDTKRKGTVVKLNLKTAHIKCSNGDVMSVSYGFIQKGRSIAAATRARGAGPKPKRNSHNPKHNPANFTAKGERAYEHIKQGYGSDPRAKEIAARTVYTMAKTTPGLVKAKRNAPAKHNPSYRRLPQIPKGYSDFDSLLGRAPLSLLRKYKDGAQYKRLRPYRRKELNAAIKYREHFMLQDFNRELLEKVSPAEGYRESMALYNKVRSSLIKKSKVPGYRGKDARAQLKVLRDQIKRQHG